jgi:hypothetical protein
VQITEHRLGGLSAVVLATPTSFPDALVAGV